MKKTFTYSLIPTRRSSYYYAGDIPAICGMFVSKFFGHSPSHEGEPQALKEKLNLVISLSPFDGGHECLLEVANLLPTVTIKNLHNFDSNRFPMFHKLFDDIRSAAISLSLRQYSFLRAFNIWRSYKTTITFYATIKYA